MKRKLLLAPIAALALGACSGKGNSGKLEIDPALIEQVPWINGRGPILDADGMAIVPGDPVYPDIASGTADPGSRSFDPARSDLAEDCAPLADVELSGWRHDFEPTEPGFAGVAQFWSAYLDYTDGAWLVPGDASWYPNIALKRNGTIWGLASQPIGNGPQCADDVPNTHALHVKGGRFNGFGGGVEHPLSLDCGGHQPRGVADLCTPDAVLNELLDLTAYDGIAFWARRGPEGSSGLQVGIQTKDTSDFLARSGKLGPVNCERIKTCQATCDNGGACTLFTQNGFEATPRYRCIPEDADPNLTLEPSLLEFLYPQCGIDTCKGPPYFADPDHEKIDDPSECKAYTFSGLEEGTWCFGKDPPAAPTERCGDGFASNVSLSTDWKFFKLPFANFRQVGFAKRADRFDLKNVYSIAFQFSVGWADFYVDNVSFYRNK
jgi:hypothetical protein